MSFIENDGGITLDVVLTDAGRARLAKGDGSFKITKFAVADDEIDYSLWNGSHPSGSAYFGVEILQTPILEAFTNNTSWMNSKLISIARQDLLFLPTIKLGYQKPGGGTYGDLGYFIVAVNEETADQLSDEAIIQGVINGESRYAAAATLLSVEQGLDTTEISRQRDLDNNLVETQYLVEIDSRLGDIVDSSGEVKTPSFIDDDRIAGYYFSLSTTPNMVERISNDSANSSIAGPRGTKLSLSLRANLNIASSDSLFNSIGSSGFTVGTTAYKYIDSNLKITGGNTGNQIDIPIRFLRK